MVKRKAILALILTMAVMMSVFTGPIPVVDATNVDGNIALGKAATASSSKGENTPNKANDDSMTTRWESIHGVDPQWITVDLGRSYRITGVRLTWATAAGKAYNIQVSKDNVTWTDAYRINDGTSEAVMEALFTAPIDGRYVRMYGIQRTTKYGYALYDFQVYGDVTPNMTPDPFIAPTTGSFTTPQTVIITDPDPQAQIYYTTDGSYPSPSSDTSILYTEPFMVSGIAKVRAVAYKAGMNESNLISADIVIMQPPVGLNAAQNMANSAVLRWTEVPGATSYNVYRSTDADGIYTKVNVNTVTANSFVDISLNANTTYYYRVTAVSEGIETEKSEAVSVTTIAAEEPDFGPNVYIFDPNMNASDIQNICDSIFNVQERDQFGSRRFAVLFKPGIYNEYIKAGYYTQIAGLGSIPDDVVVNGGVTSNADWNNGNALVNFWRSCENMAINPTKEDGKMFWAVSQAAPLRRVHVKGDLWLYKYDRSSGGILSDSMVDGTIVSGSQQQWFSRNSTWDSWRGGVWNMVFVGCGNPPEGTYPEKPYTVIDQTPIIREKPYLYVDADDQYNVFVPSPKTNSSGISWTNGQEPGRSVPIDQFYITHPDLDTSDTINAALDAGLNLLFTPGIYHLSSAIEVDNPDTVVMGLGYATLVPDNGNAAMEIADVDGVTVSGLLIDAGEINSSVLFEVGHEGSSADHSADPTLLSDVFFRIGGASAGKADISLKINSNDVIGDDFWIWRADHGNGAAWDQNTADSGLIVNGNDVTVYGLMVEHYQKYQTIWNGNGGKVYFYQSEMPYDVPDQSSWSHDGVNGYASFKVADHVLSFEGWGFGIYSYFRDAIIRQRSAVETPINIGIKFRNVCTVFLTGYGEITHIINDLGATACAGKGNTRQTMSLIPQSPEPEPEPISDVQPITDAQLDQAIEQAQDNDEITVKAPADKPVLALTPAQLQKVKDADKPLAVEVQGVKIVLPVEEITDIAGTTAAQIEINAQALEQEQSQEIMDEASNSSGLRMAQAFEFKIETVTSGGARQEIDNFAKPVTVTILVREGAKKAAALNRLAVYVYDKTGKKLTPVGGSYNEQDGTITFSAEHFSQYALIEMALIRLGGPDRFDTSVITAKQYYPKADAAILAVNANDFADGLAGSVLAGAIKAPVLLTQTNHVPAAVSQYLKEAGVKTVYILGGPEVVTPAVEAELAGYNIERIYGDNREDTAVKIAKKAKALGGQTEDTAIIVNGYTPADALVAGPPAADGMPLLMVNKDSIPAVTKDAIKELGIKDIIIVGDSGVVSAEVADELEGMVSGEVSRAGGATRVETSIELAEKLNLPNAIVVGYDGLPDAVAAGYAGALEEGAVIYTDAEQMNNAVNGYLDSSIRTDSRVSILGGSGVVGNNVESDLKERL